MSEYIIVTTATDNLEDVDRIQKELLNRKLAACIQVTNIESHYNWNNERCKTNEYLLTIKTRKSLYKSIERIIKELHSYKLPEIISYDIDNISNEYALWIDENTIEEDLIII